jgi:tetratricopeptide (TPR) repeat protein
MDDAVLAHLQQAVQAEPGDASARLALMQGLVTAERWQEAEEVGQTLLAEANPPAAVHACLGIVYAKQARVEEAVQQCRQALVLSPEDALTLFNLGVLLVRQEDVAGAIECLEKAAAQAAEWAEAHYTLGTLLLRQERTYDALRAFERATEHRTPYPEAHFNCGNAHALRGLNEDGSLDYYELDRAATSYKTAIQERPGYAAALFNLGMVYQRMRSAEGLRVWNQYLEATQEQPEEDIWRLRAQEYVRDLEDNLR